MKKTIVAFAMLVASCRTSAPTPQQHADATRAGAKLFRQHCAECHGANADGGRRAPSLHGVGSMSDEALFRFVTNGNLRRGMPSWSRLPDERRWQLIAYLRSLQPASQVSGSSTSQK